MRKHFLTFFEIYTDLSSITKKNTTFVAMKSLLEHIISPVDLRKIPQRDLPLLAQQMRDFILDIVATKEGHLGASLGVVELTIALHYIFNTPDDILVWDVGHQAYGHKLLTGRRLAFEKNRQWGGISGFPKQNESSFDSFGVGHSSTSISAVLGMATASLLQGNLTRKHIAVIGDASIVSGMAFEALNNAGKSGTNLLIILNDNQMGIDPSVGAFRDYLEKLGTFASKDTFFSALQIEYLGSIDGHNFSELINSFQKAKQSQAVQILHVRTLKGKGFKQAEKNQTKYHSPGKFDRKTGNILPQEDILFDKYQDVFGKTLLELALKNSRIVGITPAMLTGSSLTYMKEKLPKRTFDVGIAEQHAVTFAAGLATQGMLPYCVIYSTFLQRAYDQIIHDIALQNLPVILCIDRAGLVGEDGATHQGVLDIAFLRCVPNMVILAPCNEIEFRNMLYTTQLPDWKYPTAIRYPRGRGHLSQWYFPFEKIDFGKAQCLQKGQKYAILSIGTIANNVQQALLQCDNYKDFSHYDIRFIKPLNEQFLHIIFSDYQAIITIEEGIEKGGFGSAIAEFASLHKYHNPLYIKAIKDEFIEHGSVEIQKKYVGLSTDKLAIFFKNFKS